MSAKIRGARQPNASSRLEQCCVCKREMDFLFEALVLKKYQVVYRHCPECGLIQTERPYWLSEAYAQAISAQDLGLVRRNLQLNAMIQEIILDHFNPGKRFLDYAGGFGLQVRLMRDAGFDFHRHDPLCVNIFAGNFDIPELKACDQFELITACELFEHLQEPEAELLKLFAHADTVFLSTHLRPATLPREIENWWYFFPENGQHITFYTLDALQRLAKATDATLHSDGCSLHILTKRTLAVPPFQKRSSILRRLDKMLGRLRASLRKRMYTAAPPPSLLPGDAKQAKIGTFPPACPSPAPPGSQP